MRRCIHLLIVGGLLCASARGAPLYECLATDKAPKLDGRLDDACWKKAQAGELPWRWTSSTDRSDLKTEFRMLYDKKGIYLGVWLFDEQVKHLRAVHTRRDDPDTWHDDCIELYLDPELRYQNVIKLTTNSLGTRVDQRLADYGWGSEDGWQVKTSAGNDAWFVEMRIPYKDFPRPRPGDAWAMNLGRFAWSTGAFRGASWAPGAFSDPRSHHLLGQLVFGSLKEAVGILCDRAGGLLGEFEKEARVLKDTGGYRPLKSKLRAFRQQLEALAENPSRERAVLADQHRRLRRLLSELSKWQWELKLACLIEAN